MNPTFLIIDLFCGAGGTTTGFEMTNGIAKVIACVNHDPTAIKSHWLNHPEVHHFEEDIRTLDLTALEVIWVENRTKYPNAKLILWASLECTNFSKAKGGQPRDADSRTLADHLDRYVLALNPDYIQIENVVEFMSWGPLDDNGKPISRRNGSDWLRWCKLICSHGYYDQWQELDSADFGAYTTRNRLFGCFAKHDLPIVFPAPTHSKKAGGTLFDSLKPWKPVKEVLDLMDEGATIFGRKKPLVDKTLERIYAGLIKYVAGGKDAFMVKYNSMNQAGKYQAPSIDEPCPVVSVQNRLAVAFISKYYSGRPEGKVISVEGPAGTIRTSDGQALVNAQFLQAYYGTGDNVSPVKNPCPTIPTVDRFGLVSAKWLDSQFGNGTPKSVENPAGTILNHDKHNLVNAFIMPTSYSNNPKSIDEPAPTVLANRKYHYLINPSWGGNLSNTDKPCPVIVARQDKAPLSIVQTEKGEFAAIVIYEEDTEIMVKIKQFMAMYGIVDIKMRMLKVNELLKIQGFPTDYHLAGTQTDQKKFIGNSVVPHVVKAWAEAIHQKLLTLKTKAA
jgi:DNA (cytosine-5)-methyltransferase 1